MANQLAKLLAQGLGGQSPIGFGDLTLVRVTPGVRGAVLSAGNNPTTQSFTCKGKQGVTRQAFWQFWQNAQAGTGTARASFVGFTILGATLPDGITPRAGDSIISGGKTYVIDPNGATNNDGLGAAWECITRAPGG